MMEAFEPLDEGIVYGFVEDVGENYIVLDIKGQKKMYKTDKEFDIEKRKFVRVYVKEGKIIFLEKLDEKNFKKFMKLLDEIRNLPSF